MPNRRNLLMLLLWMLGVFLAGCRSEPTAEPTNAPTAVVESPSAESVVAEAPLAYPPPLETPLAYPLPTESQLAYPSPLETPLAYPLPTDGLPAYPSPVDSSPEAVPSSALDIPTPSPGKGVVTGMLVDTQTQQAPYEVLIYLGTMKQMDTGSPIVRLDRETAPFGIPVQDGRFVIPDVEPGEYGVIIFSPEFSFMADDPDGEGSYVITVSPDDTLDLGRIAVTMP